MLKYGTFGTPNTKNRALSDVLNFYNIEQYPYKFGTVRTPNGIWFIIFLFIFLSHLSVSLFLSFFLKPQSSPLSQPLIFCSLTLTALPRWSLSSNGFFFFLAVVWWVGLDGDVWVQIMLAEFSFDEGGWVRMG